MLCSNCGSKISDDSIFCTNCGAKVGFLPKAKKLDKFQAFDDFQKVRTSQADDDQEYKTPPHNSTIPKKDVVLSDNEYNKSNVVQDEFDSSFDKANTDSSLNETKPLTQQLDADSINKPSNKNTIIFFSVLIVSVIIVACIVLMSNNNSRNNDSQSTASYGIINSTQQSSEQSIMKIENSGISIPNFIGKTVNEIDDTNDEFSIKYEYTYDPKKTLNTVLEQSIKAGTNIENYTNINIVLTVNSTSATVKVPDLNNCTLKEAKDKLDALYLKYNVKEEYDNIVEKNRIIDYTNKDSDVQVLTSITLTVSKGKDPYVLFNQEKAKYGKIPTECQQFIVLETNNTYRATMTLYDEDYGIADGWSRIQAVVSKEGISAYYGENSRCTPKGTFSLCSVFIPDGKSVYTGLTVKHFYDDSIWITDPRLENYYNCFIEDINDYSDALKNYKYEKMSPSGIYGSKAPLILYSYNGNGEYNYNYYYNNNSKGSAMFINSDYSLPSGGNEWGDITILKEDMTKLLSYLDSNKNPYIVIK